MRRSSVFKVFIILAITSVFLVIAGCSDFSKDDKKVFKAIEKYQEEYYPESNKELEIEYADLKDMNPDAIVRGSNEYGEDTWLISGTYTFNHKKVSGMENMEHIGENSFDARLELRDGEPVMTSYTEGLPIRVGMDD